MTQTHLLQGKEIALRAMEPEDLEILYTLENDTTLWNISSVNVPYSKYTLKQFITTGNHDIYTDGQIRLMIEKNEDHNVIGMIDIIDFNARHHRAEIGIVLLNEYRAKGYGKQALSLIEKYAKEYLQLNQLYSFVSIENEHSINLFNSVGYKQTGMLKEWLFSNKKYIDTLFFQKKL